MKIIIEGHHSFALRGAELRSFPKHSFARYLFLVDASTDMANWMDNFRCAVPLEWEDKSM